MHIFDAHCDVLSQLYKYPKYSFQDSAFLHITNEQLINRSKIQCFAIFLSPNIESNKRFHTAMQMVGIFYEKILKPNPHIKLIRCHEDILSLKNDEIGAILTLEGGEALEESIENLQTLVRLGVSSLGLTWNYANALADGILEDRGGGLTTFGKKVVQELNKLHVWTDVSHLSVKGFWDVMEYSHFPIASHSNSYFIRPHPRNLNDEQVQALWKKNGVVGITFVPEFLRTNSTATIKDILKHIDHFCTLGGEKHIGFGSDFDGFTNTIDGLSRFLHYDQLVELLINHFPEEAVKGFLYDNFVRHFPSSPNIK